MAVKEKSDVIHIVVLIQQKLNAQPMSCLTMGKDIGKGAQLLP